MNYNQLALIVTGPRDGELILHPSSILELFLHEKLLVQRCGLQDEIEEMKVDKLTFKRVTYKVAMSFIYLDCYVPIEWTQGSDSDTFVGAMLLGHLLKKAFKGA